MDLRTQQVLAMFGESAMRKVVVQADRLAAHPPPCLRYFLALCSIAFEQQREYSPIDDQETQSTFSNLRS